MTALWAALSTVGLIDWAVFTIRNPGKRRGAPWRWQLWVPIGADAAWAVTAAILLSTAAIAYALLPIWTAILVFDVWRYIHLDDNDGRPLAPRAYRKGTRLRAEQEGAP